MNNNRQRGFETVSLHQWEKDRGSSILRIDEIKLPKRATKHSAGYDVFSTQDVILNPGDDVTMPLGWKTYMLENEFLMIIPRSGLGFKYYTRLANSTGIIDFDYYGNSGNDGHCWIKLRNEGDKTLMIHSGDAIAQCIFTNFFLADGDDFEGNKRIGGFGSTG